MVPSAVRPRSEKLAKPDVFAVVVPAEVQGRLFPIAGLWTRGKEDNSLNDGPWSATAQPECFEDANDDTAVEGRIGGEMAALTEGERERKRTPRRPALEERVRRVEGFNRPSSFSFSSSR